MTGPNLDLPPETPDSVQSAEASFSLRPFALYVLVGITEDDYALALEKCNSKYGNHDNSVHRPSKYNFIGEPLQAAFDYHLHQERFDKMTFLAVTSLNWKEVGIYLVTLDDERGHVDAALIPAEETGMVLVNLQIGNSDWPEIKKRFSSCR